MKSLRSLPFLAFFVTLLCPHALPAAPATAEGYWEGAISLPDQALAIHVDLAPAGDAAWRGTIDIPTQGMRGFNLDPVRVTDHAVEFSLPGVPGDPRFSGTLADDARTIAGDFFQGGSRLPFRLERKPKPAAPTPEAEDVANGVPGKGLAGKWRGVLVPLPNAKLRLALEIAPGKLEGVLVSLDQGAARIPISVLQHEEGKVHFETPSVRGEYHGVLNADGSEIAGEWNQAGRITPLVFKRLPAAAMAP